MINVHGMTCHVVGYWPYTAA